MKRREIREHIFRMLFCMEFHEKEEFDEQKALYFGNIGDFYQDPAEAPSEEEVAELKDRFREIENKIGEIDMILSQTASGWRLNRMGRVDLSILRLAVYEIRFDEAVPDKVAINEAVELAKIYGGDSSGGFVNGVLAKLVRPEE